MDKRRNITGINVLYKFEEESEPQLTSIEDTSEERMQEWVKSMDNSTLQTMTIYLLKVIRGLGDKFDVKVNLNKLKDESFLKSPEDTDQ